jgi:hypothetical protein
MEQLGATYGVILNDPELRQALIHDTVRSRRSSLTTEGSRRLRQLFALALLELASRVDPAPRTLEFRPAPAGTLQ